MAASSAGLQGFQPYTGQPPPPYSAVPSAPYANAQLPGGFPPPNNSTMPATQLEIHVQCKNLLDMDVFSKSDPMTVMYTQALGGNEWREYGRTEVIQDTLNPVFVKSFNIHYFFEEIQKLRFEVYDIDSKSTRLSNHDFIGEMECTLGSIVGENGGRLEKPLVTKGQKPAGVIIVTAEEMSECRDVVTVQFDGKKLDKKDWFGKSDPFLVFYRCNEDNSFTAVHKTEVIKNTLNPTWKPFSISSRSLCNGDKDRAVRVECYDWNRDGSHELIGIFTTNLRQMTNPNMSWDCVNPQKQAKKKGYKHSGVINLIYCKVEQQATFLDYIVGGTQINFVVAVDFTASNGNPLQGNSLHYLNPYEPNLYVKALSAVGKICEDYDSDKLFPAFGFGAKIPPYWHVSHQFPLNEQIQNPFCQGVDGVIAAYHNMIQKAQLYGPTNFAPIIHHVSEMARQSEISNPGGDYFVLLMLTDGIISDMAMTKEAIVNAASFPVSIIIVGIGSADFDAMEELDGDVVRLSSRGREAERDIVQFVPFRDYVRGSGDVTSAGRLAKDVLAELPDQFIEYVKKRNIKPLARSTQRH